MGCNRIFGAATGTPKFPCHLAHNAGVAHHTLRLIHLRCQIIAQRFDGQMHGGNSVVNIVLLVPGVDIVSGKNPFPSKRRYGVLVAEESIGNDIFAEKCICAIQ